MAVIRCLRCKTITGSVANGTQSTVYTFDPCYDCQNRDRLIRERNAQIRRTQAAAKAGREDR
mgnify:CR=1 FL=1